MDNLKEYGRDIISLCDEIKKYQDYKNSLKKIVKETKNPEELKKKLQDKTEAEWLQYYDSYISQLYDKILEDNNQIKSSFVEIKEIKKEAKEKVDDSGKIKLDVKTKKKYIEELNIDKEYLKSLIPGKSKEDEVVEYTLYQSTSFGKISNSFFEKISRQLINSSPKFFDNLNHALRAGDLKILTKTYVSICLLSSVLAFFFVTLLVLGLSSHEVIIFDIIKSLILGFLAGIGCFAVVFMYPAMIANSRRRAIKNDLPFVVVHMAAIAGSGAQPIAMFNLVLNSKEYMGIEAEIKKIVNYVNIFGYDLSTAMRTVAITTPSKDFKELLIGLTTTIESGGSIRDYLDAKAEDTMINYKLERKKYVESLATYSDIYTGILIAAPLLFFVTLAIIQMLGGEIMGVSVETLAKVGTFGVLPLLNVGFIIFLNISQPEA